MPIKGLNDKATKATKATTASTNKEVYEVNYGLTTGNTIDPTDMTSNMGAAASLRKGNKWQGAGNSKEERGKKWWSKNS